MRSGPQEDDLNVCIAQQDLDIPLLPGRRVAARSALFTHSAVTHMLYTYSRTLC